MPEPRAGSAMVRASSCHTTTLAMRPMPRPPYSSGTSIIQMPSSLARALELRAPLGLQLLAVASLAFDGDHVLVDEAAHLLAEHGELFGKLEVHRGVS